MLELGIFGGTFNPIHYGHLNIAEFARQKFSLTKVIFVTAARPPHRGLPDIDMHLRHDLVQLAIASNKYFEASTIELGRSGPSYTIDTLESFRTEYGANCRLNYIVGEDNIKGLPTWHRAKELSRICRFLIAPRLGGAVLEESLQELRHNFPKVEAAAVNSPIIEFSSTTIRERLTKGQSIKYMVPESVEEKLLSLNFELKIGSN